MKKLIMISLFCGCGGSSLGYKMVGYKELLGVDWDDNAIESFKLNFSDVPVWKRDITKLSGKEIMDFCNIEKGELDLLDGSPPCQGFSTAGKRKIDDIRNDLVLHFIRLIDEMQPKVFVMENVSGMIKGKMKGIFKEYMIKMKKLDYNVKCKLMNAMYYNVPQSRQRLIWIGVRKDLKKEPVYPIPNKKIITVKEVINDLSIKMIPEINHIWINEEIKNTKNYNRIKSNKRQGKFYKKQRMRIYENKPLPTITTGGEISIPYMLGNSMAHYKYDRTLSIRELARCHSFPDDFKFLNDMIHTPARIGNSVPPLMIKAIAECIKKEILEKTGDI